MTSRRSASSRSTFLHLFRRSLVQDLYQRFRAGRGRKLGIESLEDRALLATVTWDGGAGTLNYADAANWSTNLIPTASDDVIIPDLVGSPIIVLTGNRTVNSLVSEETIQWPTTATLRFNNDSVFHNGARPGGALIVSAGATLVLQGNSSWLSGTINGPGIVRNEGVLQTPGSGGGSLIGTLVNAGTFIRNGSLPISIVDSTTSDGLFTNLASGVIEIVTGGNQTVFNSSGTIDNFGTIRLVDSASGEATIACRINDHGGTIESVNPGSHLRLAGTSVILNGTHFSMPSATAKVEVVSSVNADWLGTLTGTGSGRLILNGTNTFAAANWATPSGMLWTTETSVFKGDRFHIPSGTDFHVEIVSTQQLSLQTNMEIDGELLHSAFGAINVTASASLLVSPQGRIRISDGPTPNNRTVISGAGRVENRGDIEVSSATGKVFTVSGTFDNFSGSIHVVSGDLRINSPSTLNNGHFIGNMTFGGTPVWSGTFTGGGVTQSNALNIDPAGAIFDFATGFTVKSSFIRGGNLTVPAGATFIASGGTVVVKNNVDVYGTFSQTLSTFTINNPGVLHIRPGGLLLFENIGVGAEAGSTGGLLFNEGTMRTSQTTSTIGVTLDTPGTVDVPSGFRLRFSGHPIVQHQGTTLVGGTWNIAGTINFPVVDAGFPPVATIGPNASIILNGSAASFSSVELNQLLENQGTLIVKNGKSFSPNQNFVNRGRLTIDAATVTMPSVLTVLTDYTQASGLTNLASGGSLIARNVVLNGGVLGGNGIVSAVVNNVQASVRPGSSPGKLNISGNYVQGANASLDIEVGGTNPTIPQFDQLIVSGDANLDGTLNVSVINDFLPSKGETFRFLTANHVLGDFSTKNLAVYQEYPLFAAEKGSNYYDLTSRNIIVRNTNDADIDSLRQAILTANLANDFDNILLHIPGAGPHTIAPLTELPIITQPVNIDGYAQTGAARNTLSVGSDTILKVELSGAAVASGTGLLIQSDNVTVTGLAITGWADEGVVIEAPADSGTRIVGNFIGLKTDGVTAAPNSSGVLLDAGARNVIIGGSTPATRNVISGNSNVGVLIESGGTTGNVVIGNYIGTNAQGNVAVGNSAGILIDAGAAANIIGGSTAAARNVISGNLSRDVWINGAGSELNSVQGNFIGLNASGNASLGVPASFGVLVDDNANSNVIGGPTSIAGTGSGNVIAGHVENIRLEADSTLVQGNLIGTNASGTAVIGGSYGVVIASSLLNGNLIGGNSVNSRNVISGNSLAGVRLENAATMHNTVAGNFIGLNRAGDDAIPNGIGVQLAGLTSNNTIGGIDSTFGNTISGNTFSGIEITGAGTSNNSVVGNTIGLTPAGNGLPNFDGIQINNAAGNTIGGSTFASHNTISGNSNAGVRLSGVATSTNLVQSNAIGTDVSATLARPNAIGVLIDSGAHDNFVGQSTSARNIISGNGVAGVRLTGGATINNSVAGNTIGLGMNAEIVGNAIGILDDGSGSTNTIGGVTTASRNTISGNQGAGIWTLGSTSGVTISGNIIGLDPNGTVDRGNQGTGIVVDSTAIQIVNNTISGNGLDGIDVSGANTTISLNRIGLDHSGAFAIGNDGHGVLMDSSATSNNVVSNTIAGNSAGIRDAGTLSIIQSNFIGTNSSGLKMLGNRRGSGAATNGHFGILASGSSALVGDVASGNVIAGHDIGIWLKDAVSSTVRGNQIGTDALEVASLSNTVGLQMSGTTAGTTLDQNAIANSLTVGLRLLDGTSTNNQFTSNRYFGNLGVAIDAAGLGATLNDTNDSDGLLNFPVLDFADILADSLVVRGYVGAGRSVELYVSTPTINGLGQGATSLGIFVEGSAADSASGTGTYGPDVRGVTVGAAEGSHFEFTIPLNSLPSALRYGSLITAVALGSTSEFGNAIPIGDPASALAPQVFLPLGVSLVQGESLRVQGSFRDDDSTSWTLLVDYDDGAGPQPLDFAPDHTFILEHTYPDVSSVPYQVIVTAVDNANRVGVGVMGVSVGNDPPQPTFNSFEFTPVVLEGQAVTLEGSFTDSGDNDSHTVSIDWGDGSTPTLIPLPLGARHFTSLHVYPDDGLSGSSSEFYRIRITVSDNLGGFSTTPDGLYIVEVKNELPTIPTVTAPASLVENQLFGLSGSFDDPGLLDTHTVTVDWGDGSPVQSVGTSQLISSPSTHVFSLLHRYPDNPVDQAVGYNVTIEVVDDDQPLAPVRVKKFIEVVNETPSVTLITPSVVSLNEGESFSLDVQFDDSGPSDSHQVVIDWGDGQESKVIDLGPGVFQIPTVNHRYVNNPSSGSLYTLQVKLRDKDMPSGVFVTDTRQFAVSNVAPTVTELKLFTRSGRGPWVEQTAQPTIVEGDEVKIVGKFSDPGKSDVVIGNVHWSAGITTPVSVSLSNRTFESAFRYTDDFATGTLFDDEAVLVTLSDGDGGTGTATTTLRVANAAPIVSFIPGVVTNPQFIPLTAQVQERGQEAVSLQWQATNGTSVVQTGSGQNFAIDLALLGTGPIVVSVNDSDDDGGTHSFTAGVVLGTANADTLTITAATFLAAGVDTLLVLGLGGNDILDASAVPAPYRVILDGGDAQDFLYGGGGNDIFILRAGDDSANVDPIHYPTPVTALPIPNIVPNYAGNDHYYLKPNSTLTVVDLEGNNGLDYSIASFGIEFSLAVATGTALIPQAVAAGGHFVAAVGSFDELIGSAFADSLTGASGASTYGSEGADSLKAITGTANANFFGGQDADLFETAGTGLTGISFEGDDGADIFTNLGSLSGGVIFSGGADADLFTNFGTIFSEISFEGDDGADIFSNEPGGVLTGIIFEGDAGSDRFVNRGLINATSFTGTVRGDDGADIFDNLGSLTGVIFTGGADADLFTNELSGSLGGVSFEGDDGADIFTNAGHLLTEVIFTGGADADLFTNTGSGLIDSVFFQGDDGADIFSNEFGGEILIVSFEGDDGADIFSNSGDLGSELTEVIFSGGADADMFVNETTGVLFSLSFEGDDGADIFVNSGTIDSNALGDVVFTGGADADLFTNTGSGLVEGVIFEGDDGADVFSNLENGLITSVSFQGDDGADIFNNFGDLTVVIFSGGADADLFVNHEHGIADSVSFEGDDGADIFINAGDLLGGVVFSGGADGDALTNSVTGVGTGLVFHGDDGADVFTNFGTLSGDPLGGVSFEGDDGADIFINDGVLQGGLGTIIFTGGADADMFVNSDDGILTTISFEGDDGADIFANLGDVLTEVVFTGGADADRLINYDSNIASIRFIGFVGPASAATIQDDGADLFSNYGDFITTIRFEGDDGADIFQNSGDWIESISFNGDDGADIFISTGSDLVSLNFEGDAGSDVLGVNGSALGSIVFEGASGDSGNDTFVNRSTPSAGGTAQLRFVGFDGLDAFRNDGADWQITYLGGRDDDTFQNNATTQRDVLFIGDDGADVFENNGDQLVSVHFEGDQGSDVLANGGEAVSNMVFSGGVGNDTFVNSGSRAAWFVFHGDDGADIFSNIGMLLTDVSFEGDAGNDRVSNYGVGLSGLNFVGGAGSDSLLNREQGSFAQFIQFQSGASDDGADVFTNWAAELGHVTFEGGADADLFQNFGANLHDAQVLGGAGNDQVLNTGAGLFNFTFTGADDNDVFENLGEHSGNVIFEGNAGADSLILRGAFAASVSFDGGTEADTFTNYAMQATSLVFHANEGNDRFQNNGDDINRIEFYGDAGADAFQNNGDRIATIFMDGGTESDSLYNNGSNIGAIQFLGRSGADAIIQTGNAIGSIHFDGSDDADVFRSSGLDVTQATFIGGPGDDAMLWDTRSGIGSTVQFAGDLGNDALIFRGASAVLGFAGEVGQDRVVYSGDAAQAEWDGGQGDDRYEFLSRPTGFVIIRESYSGPTDASRDTLDFASFDGPVTLDLNVLSPQAQPGNLSLALPNANSIESVIGSSGADTLLGNDRDNYLAGARFYYPNSASAMSTSQTAGLRPTQWVWLDFDTYTQALIGEHVYTLAERAAVLQRMRSAFEELNAGGLRVAFATNRDEIPTNVDFATIQFNDTPLTGRPGGEASEIDFGNVNLSGFARVQVNGLLGGIEVPINKEGSFVEELPEDGDTTIGQDKPAATSENFVALSAKMATHELAHLLGVRHYDSFGPVGFGIHAPPGIEEFNPLYSGPAAAFESFDHIIGSPASIGSTRINDVGSLFFGERESIKLAFATASDRLNYTGGWVREAAGSNSQPSTPQPLSLTALAVPNSMMRGLNSSKEFYVDVAAVPGEIQLLAGQSENDYYSFAGRAGETVTVEVMSMSLDRFTSQGVDGFIDSTIRLYRVGTSGQWTLVPFFDTSAVNDDEFESTDSLLMDVLLPADGNYVIEVDTFTRAARADDPQGTALDSMPADARAALEDVLNDQDVGKYELFVYRFADASSVDLIDYLDGRLGNDIIDGGPGDLGTVQFLNMPETVVMSEGSYFQQLIEFLEPRGESWTMTIDFGDGSPVAEPVSVVPGTTYSTAHLYQADGTYEFVVTVSNNYGLVTSHTILVEVANVAPEIVSLKATPPSTFEGQAIELMGTISDPGTLDPHTLEVNWGDGSSPTTIQLNAGVLSFTATHVYLDDNAIDPFAIQVVIADEMQTGPSAESTVTVSNVAPTAVTSGPVTIDEGNSTTVSLASPTDASSVDALSLRYSFALSSSGLATSYGTADPTGNASFTFADNGTYTVYGRVIDKDGGFTDYSSVVTVRNVAPTAVLTASATVTVGSAAAVSFSNPIEPALADVAAGLRYSFALSPSGLADSYGAASTAPDGLILMPSAGTVTVWGRVIDKDGGFTDYSALVVVTGNTTNLPPTVLVNAPTSGIRGQVNNFSFAAQDPDLIDALGPFVYTIQWGDGTTSIVTGGTTVTVSKTFLTVSPAGSFTIVVTATDARHAVSLPAAGVFSALGWSIMPDPLHPGNTMLVVVGSPHDDVIKIKDEDHHSDYLKVSIRDREEHVRVRGYVSGNVDAILVFGLKGDDRITIDSDVELPVTVWGGDGDDRIKGGEGSDVLVGEQGNDVIYGGEGRDLLIGGAGADRLYGDDDQDILIAGYTTFDLNRQALDAIMAEWNSTRDYSMRRLNLMGINNSSFNNRRNGGYFLRFRATNANAAVDDTVFDDGAQDSLWGNDSRDWFMLNSDGDHSSAKDHVKDQSSGESSDDIDRWY